MIRLILQLRREQTAMRQLTDRQKVFLLSRVNGTHNNQELLPTNYFQFPEFTWFKSRLAYVRQRELVEAAVGEAERAKLQGRMQ